MIALTDETSDLLSNVTLACDDVSKSKHTFQYMLNSTRTRKKLLEGALRAPYEREDKKTCINLIFSDGAFKEVVLKALTDLKDGPTHFIVRNEEVEKVDINPRSELSGKHIDTKIHFKVNGSKIVIHVYNSTQKLTVQGSKYEWFVDHYLEPFFVEKIEKRRAEIDALNKDVRSALNPKRKSKVKKAGPLEEESENVNCDKCEYNTKNADDLRKHIVKDHTVNVFQGLDLSSPRQIETRAILNNSEHTDSIEIEVVEEISEGLDHDVVIEETTPVILDEDEFTCEKCNVNLSSKKELEKHIELHFYADNLSVTFHICRICNKAAKKTEATIQCSKCIYFFHKKCTAVNPRAKKASIWTCHICSNPTTDLLSIQSLDAPSSPGASGPPASCSSPPPPGPSGSRTQEIKPKQR